MGLRITAVVAAAAAVTVGVVVVTTNGTGTVRPADGHSAVDRPDAALPPYAKPAKASEFLENAAWTAAARRTWVNPRPDQFMYVEFLTTENRREIADAEPNGALVPGHTVNKRRETWMRVDGEVMGGRGDGGQVHSRERTRQQRRPTVYRWLARQPGAQVDPNGVNLDGRPAA